MRIITDSHLALTAVFSGYVSYFKRYRLVQMSSTISTTGGRVLFFLQVLATKLFLSSSLFLSSFFPTEDISVPSFPQWGIVDTEIRVPSAENPELLSKIPPSLHCGYCENRNWSPLC